MTKRIAIAAVLVVVLSASAHPARAQTAFCTLADGVSRNAWDYATVGQHNHPNSVNAYYSFLFCAFAQNHTYNAIAFSHAGDAITAMNYGSLASVYATAAYQYSVAAYVETADMNFRDAYDYSYATAIFAFYASLGY